MRLLLFGFTALAATSYLVYAFTADEPSARDLNRTHNASLPAAPRVFEHTRTGDLGEQHIVVENKHKSPSRNFSQSSSFNGKKSPIGLFSKKEWPSDSHLEGFGADEDQSAQLAALGIKPRESQFPSKITKEKGFSKRLSKGRILAKRWDKKVSGPHAHPAVFGSKGDVTCSPSNEKFCERRNARDATITGVVVETDRLSEEPSHPLEGRIKAGHYVEATPALYVK